MLIKCKECGHAISRSAKVCPNCGNNLNKAMAIIIVISAILVILGIAVANS